MKYYIPQKWKLWVICITLGATVLLSERRVERVGDNLQVALPMLGLACSITNGQALEYTLRFVAMEVVLHGFKNGLGEAWINERPAGGHRGFPSGHTTAAVYGATSLVNDCITHNPVVKGAVILSAAYVGGSRIEADKHSTVQVLAGIILGWGSSRALRSGGGLVGRLRRAITSRRRG